MRCTTQVNLRENRKKIKGQGKEKELGRTEAT